MKTKKLKVTKILGMMGVLVLIGCAKERPVEQVYKEEVMSKSAISTSDEYLYVPSVVDSPRKVSASRPYWMGEAKIVKLQFAKDNLEVVEVDNEQRFTGNEVNNSPVMTIPVEYTDYRCRQDEYGKCTNKEEVNNDIPWSSKNYVKLKVEGLNVTEVNYLPLDLDNLFASCHRELGTKVLNYQVDGDGLNIHVEKTYSSNPDCREDLRNLSELTFKVRYHYSLVKLNHLASKDYKPVQYKRADEGAFGFFTTETEKLSVDNRRTLDSKTTLMNRWNPERKVIQYFLSDNFSKPEHKEILKATHKAVESVNNAYKKAGVDLKIELIENGHKNSGDLRNSMLVMVEDPQDSGLLGYGPSIANPRTGEIVHGRVVMYHGNMIEFIRNTYNELVEERNNSQNKSQVVPALMVQQNLESNSMISNSQNVEVDYKKFGEDLVASLDLVKIEKQAKAKKSEQISDLKTRLGKMISTNINGESSEMSKKLEDMYHYVDVLSKSTAYHGALFNFRDALEAALSPDLLNEVFGSDEELVPWIKLSVEKRKQLVDKIAPYIWIPTLVHEIGHTQGLRHNFGGSEDKHNFYSREELDHMGIKTNITYSSVMDYAYSTLSELPIMGKYDIAALKFGYKREVELADGSVVKIKDTLEDEKISNLKEFNYCTDEHVDMNPGCKRFDEGTSLNEIAEHFVRDYNKNFKFVNYRNDRENFSAWDDVSYMFRRMGAFKSLRIFFETYDRISKQFDISKEVWQCIDALENVRIESPNEMQKMCLKGLGINASTQAELDEQTSVFNFLRNVKKGSDIAGKFFVDVIKTPDLSCVVVNNKKPEQIVAIKPLRDFSKDAVSCYDEDVKIKQGYSVVGEVGRLINNKKDRKNNNPYIDQIDVRGVWLDKLLATKFLFERELKSPSFDQYIGNFVDSSEIGTEVKNMIDELLLDKVAVKTTIRLKNGNEVKGFAYEANFYDSHMIEKPLHPGLAWFWGLKSSENPMIEKVMNIVKTRMPHEKAGVDAMNFLKSYEVYREVPADGRKLKDYKIMDTVDGRFLALTENTMAIKLFKKIEDARVVANLSDKLTVEEVQKVIDHKLKGDKIPQLVSMGEKRRLYSLDIETLQDLIKGQPKSEEYYSKVLRILPTSQN